MDFIPSLNHTADTLLAILGLLVGVLFLYLSINNLTTTIRNYIDIISPKREKLLSSKDKILEGLKTDPANMAAIKQTKNLLPDLKNVTLGKEE